MVVDHRRSGKFRWPRYDGKPALAAAVNRRSSGVSLLELVVGRSSDPRCDNYLGQRTDILSKASSGSRAAVPHSPDLNIVRR